MNKIRKKSYDVEFDFDQGIINVFPVGETRFSMHPKNMDMSKAVNSKDKIVFIDAYPSMDIIYYFYDYKIKEEIVLKDENCPESIDIEVIKENCKIFNDIKDKSYRVFGKDGNQLFCIEEPFIENRNIDAAVTASYSELKSEIKYYFEKKKFTGLYPIRIDPTLSFSPDLPSYKATENRLSRKNKMFVTSQTVAPDYISQAPESYVKHKGRIQKYFSSEDMVFEKNIRIIFPFFTSSEVDSITVTISQGKTVKKKTFPSSGGESYQTDTYESPEDSNINVEYLYVDMVLPTSFERKVHIVGEVKLDSSSYGDFSIAYERVLSYVKKPALQFSSDDIITVDEDGQIINSQLIVSHSSDFKPVEYNMIPFEFDDIHVDDLANTATYAGGPDKIENKNSGRTNVNFDFNIDSIPKPIFSSDDRDSISSNFDVETILKTLPGTDYTLVDNQSNPMPKYFQITEVGSWEFWALFADINYDTSPEDVRPFVIVKNNLVFDDSILVIGFDGSSSVRKEWIPGDTNTNDFWQNFTDNTGNSELEFFEKLRDEYIVNKKSPFAATGTGIESIISFSHEMGTSKPNEVVTAKMTINVSEENFFDLSYEFRNLTGNTIKYITLPHNYRYVYLKNFMFHTPGINNFNRRTKFDLNHKNNDPLNVDFNWVPIVRGETDSIAELFGSSNANNPPSDNYIPIDRRNASEEEIKPEEPFTTGDSRNDPRFIESENDPRWYTGPDNSTLIHDLADPDKNWPYIDPTDNTDNWNMAPLIEPFLVAEKTFTEVNPGGGVFAVVPENPFALFYSTDGLVGSGEANEYKTKIGFISGVEEIKNNNSDKSRTRFFYDTVNTSRESWYNNVFLNLDLEGEETTYSSTSSGSGFSGSFKNNAEVILKSAINDRNNIECNKRYQKSYTYVDPEDFSYAIDNDDGTAISGRISLSNSQFGLNLIQKTSFLYQKNTSKTFKLFENVHTLKCTVTPPVVPTDPVFTEGSKIRQQKTGATAIVISEDVDPNDNSIRTLTIYKILRVFNETDIFEEISNFDGLAGEGTPSGKPKSLRAEENTMLRFITTDSEGEQTGLNNIFVQGFDRTIPVLLRDDFFQSNWSLKSLTNSVFKGGYFHYEDGNSILTLDILDNTINTLILKGSVSRKIKNIDNFSITFYNPNELNIDFLSEGYKEKKSLLQKGFFSKNGDIIYRPVEISVEENKPTEIITSIRDNRNKFGGIKKLVNIGGETVFDLTGTSENPVRIFGYVQASGTTDLDLSVNKIPLRTGGVNLDTVIVPTSLLGKVLFLDVTTSLPAENVKAVVTLKAGDTVEIDATQEINDKRFILKIDQSSFGEYHNIKIEFDAKAGASLDSLGVLEDQESVGISLADDVITKAMFKAVDYIENQDFFTFDDFEALTFTEKTINNDPSYKYRLAVKTLIDGFEDSALVHNNADNFWNNSNLFIPAYEIDDSKIKENTWKKSGSEVLTKYLNYKENNVDLKFNIRHFFRKTTKEYFTRIMYVNRGNDLSNPVFLYRIDLNHLLQYLPESLHLPEEDFSPEEKTQYENDFREFASENFKFTLLNGNKEVGIGSEELLENTGFNVGDSVIYPIGYSNTFVLQFLNISNITSGLQYNDSNLDVDIKVATGNLVNSHNFIKNNFKIPKLDGTGRIEGEIQLLGSTDLTRDKQNDFDILSEEYLVPFLGNSGDGTSIIYGVGIDTLRTNHGFEFGIRLRYEET